MSSFSNCFICLDTKPNLCIDKHCPGYISKDIQTRCLLCCSFGCRHRSRRSQSFPEHVRRWVDSPVYDETCSVVHFRLAVMQMRWPEMSIKNRLLSNSTSKVQSETRINFVSPIVQSCLHPRLLAFLPLRCDRYSQTFLSILAASIPKRT